MSRQVPNPIWHLAPGGLHVFPALAVQFVPAGGAPGVQGQATTAPGVPLKHSVAAGTGVGPTAGTLVVSQYHAPRTPIPTANKTKTPTATVKRNRLLILVSLSFIGSSSLAIVAMEHSLERIVDSAFQMLPPPCSLCSAAILRSFGRSSVAPRRKQGPVAFRPRL